MHRENNDALTALFRLWAWEADWMVCKGCKRPLIASRDGEELGHAAGCQNAEHQHPWGDLRQAMGMPEEAQALFERLRQWRERQERDKLGRARQIVIETQRGSVSTVQRRLNIRYSEAEHLLNLLEKEGVVGPLPERGGGRRVLVKQENAAATNPRNPQTPAP